MKLFVDSANIAEIEELVAAGLIDGATTNPSLVAKSGGDFKQTVKKIAGLVPGPVSAEVAATDTEGMIAEGRVLARLAENIAVKVPLTLAGLKACRTLTAEGTMVNVTLCFSANQALLAAKAGATFISPFIGRLDDIGHDGMQVIADILEIFRQYPTTINTEVLTASVRTVNHVIEAARLGSHIATMPPKVLRELVKHPLTDKGLTQFVKDWQETGQRIV
jgi:transaldolase